MTTRPGASRRKFLTTLGIGSAAAAAVAITRRDAGPRQPAQQAATADGKGYQLTEHVRNYYRTAKV